MHVQNAGHNCHDCLEALAGDSLACLCLAFAACRYPRDAALPPLANPTITDLAMLAKAAASDSSFLASNSTSAAEALGSRTLLQAAYAKYGYGGSASTVSHMARQERREAVKLWHYALVAHINRFGALKAGTWLC